jgi:hypothetical protein
LAAANPFHCVNTNQQILNLLTQSGYTSSTKNVNGGVVAYVTQASRSDMAGRQSEMSLQPNLPDFSRHNIPKREKSTKQPLNIPNGLKIYQMATKYTKWPKIY